MSYNSAAVASKRLFKTIPFQIEISKRTEARISRSLAKDLASRDNLIARAAEIDVAAFEAQQYQTALNSVDLRAKLNKLYDKGEPEMQGYQTLIQTLIVNNTPVDIATQAINVTPQQDDDNNK